MNEILPKKPPSPADRSSDEGSGGKGGVRLVPGNKAPDFDLPDDAGSKVTLAGFRGQLLVLYFYPKDDTSGCTKEAIDFNALQGEFEQAGAAILGVSADSVASHARFKAKHKLEIALGSDDSKAMLAAYGVWTEKSMYGRKYMGIERTTLLIFRYSTAQVVNDRAQAGGADRYTLSSPPQAYTDATPHAKERPLARRTMCESQSAAFFCRMNQRRIKHDRACAGES